MRKDRPLPWLLPFTAGAILLLFSSLSYSETIIGRWCDRVEPTRPQYNLLDEHVEKIISTLASRETIDKYSYLAPLSQIAENDYNLNIPRYVDTFEEEEEVDLFAVIEDQEKLKARLAELEGEMAKYLEELAYANP